MSRSRYLALVGAIYVGFLAIEFLLTGTVLHWLDQHYVNVYFYNLKRGETQVLSDLWMGFGSAFRGFKAFRPHLLAPSHNWARACRNGSRPGCANSGARRQPSSGLSTTRLTAARAYSGGKTYTGWVGSCFTMEAPPGALRRHSKDDIAPALTPNIEIRVRKMPKPTNATEGVVAVVRGGQ